MLLGLSRGSGTRSLAGMPPVRVEEGVTYLRPFLGLRRTDMLDICDAETLTPWIDPTNTDETLMRARIRHSVLPYLEEHLGGDVARSLARTASVAGPDAEYLDEQAQACLRAGTPTRRNRCARHRRRGRRAAGPCAGGGATSGASIACACDRL